MSRMKVWFVLGLSLALAAPALAAEDEEKQVRRIKIKKIVECADGEDCKERSRQVVFIGEDGDVRLLDGDDDEWVSEDGVRILESGGHQVVLIEDAEGDGEGDGTALRSVRRTIRRLGDSGRPLHGLHRRHGRGTFLGVELSDLTSELRVHFGVPEDAGVLIGKVVDGSPAFRAGLEVGDIVTAVDSEPIGSASALAREIRGREDGDTVVLEVWRDGRMQHLDAALEERERRRMAMASSDTGDVIEVRVDCDDGEDCTVDVNDGSSFEFAASACGDAAECDVTIDCDDGDCACTVNGETTDCSGLPGFFR